MKGLENIDLPENIDEITSDAIEKGEKYRRNNKKRKVGMIAASFVAFMIIGTSIGSDGVKAAIEGLTNKIETYFDGRFNTEPIKDYKANVGITSESKGMEVTLNEFFMDNENAYINMNFKSENGLEFAQGVSYGFYLNGKPATGGNSSGGSYIYNKDNSVDILLSRNMDKVDLKSITDVKIKIYSIGTINKKKEKNTLKGNWEFNFKYDGEKIASKVKDVEINKTISLPNNNIDIYSLKVTPMNFSVNYSLDYNSPGEEKWASVGVLNDKGELIKSNGGYGGTVFTTEIMMDTKDMIEVTLVPYEYKNGKKLVVYKDKAVKVKIK